MKFETTLLLAATFFTADARSGHKMQKLMQASPEADSVQENLFTNLVNHFPLPLEGDDQLATYQ